MYQPEIIKELLAIYKAAVACSKAKNHSDFYACLKSFLNTAAQNSNTNNKETTLLNYQMVAKTYVDSNLISFNISIATFLLSILGLIIKIKNVQVLSPLCIILLLFVAALTAIKSILDHLKQRKIREILFILENNTQQSPTTLSNPL